MKTSRNLARLDLFSNDESRCGYPDHWELKTRASEDDHPPNTLNGPSKAKRHKVQTITHITSFIPPLHVNRIIIVNALHRITKSKHTFDNLHGSFGILWSNRKWLLSYQVAYTSTNEED